MNDKEKTELIESAENLVDEANRLLILAGADYVITVMDIVPISVPQVSGNEVSVDFGGRE